MNHLYTKQFQLSANYNESLLETKNFKVVPSLGSLVEGWVLIVPKKHYLSFGYLENHLFGELNELHTNVISILKNLYNIDVISFENGTLEKESSVGCGVDYAHIHYVPLEMDIISSVSKFYDNNITWEKVNTLLSMKKKIGNSTPYLFIEDNLGDKYISEITQPTSQLIRKLIAKQLGKEDQFDWKKHHFEDNINKTIEKFDDFTPNYKRDLQIA